MGHMYPSNLCTALKRHLYAKGSISIAALVAHCVKVGEEVHCAEGAYDDEDMIDMAVYEITLFYATEGVIEPDPRRATEEQAVHWARWLRTYARRDWRSWTDEDGELLDAIPFRYTKGSRARYLARALPTCDYIEH